jgi:nitrogen fixation/metabolism regulation signal transduction histidine kinase
MGFNNFRANIVLRVLVLVALSLVLTWSSINTSWVGTPFACAALMLLSVFELIRYLERATAELTSFLNFVAHEDFSTPVTIAYKGKVFTELSQAYRILTGTLRRLNLQKAANYQYLEAVIEHVGIPLCCFDDSGEVKKVNEAAHRLFGVPYLHSNLSFGRIDLRLPELLSRLTNGERTLLDIRRGDDTLQLVLYATTFELLGRQYKLVSFHNIHDELDQQEIDSWRKLIRVLTHEIMNSVTPIISLSRLVRETMIDESNTLPEFRTLLPQEQADMLRSVTAIHARSSGLLDFVQAYRSFAKLPEPVFSDVDVRALLERVDQLMSQETGAAQIMVDLQCGEAGLTVHADAAQAEQVLINLLRNAVDALAGRPQPRIELRGFSTDQGKVLLQVSDNGAGILAEHLDSIFVPFFTTKRNGTGVGLSISRQLMRVNRGGITVRSTPGEGTVFTLRFQGRGKSWRC